MPPEPGFTQVRLKELVYTTHAQVIVIQGFEATELAGELEGRDQAGRLWFSKGLQCSFQELHPRSGHPLVQVYMNLKVKSGNALLLIIY